MAPGRVECFLASEIPPPRASGWQTPDIPSSWLRCRGRLDPATELLGKLPLRTFSFAAAPPASLPFLESTDPTGAGLCSLEPFAYRIYQLLGFALGFEIKGAFCSLGFFPFRALNLEPAEQIQRVVVMLFLMDGGLNWRLWCRAT